jgi:hypothetical protein
MVEERISHGLHPQVSYTFSKVMDDLVGYSAFPSTGNLYGNQLASTGDWGPSDYNIPQRFIVDYDWSLPNFQGGSGVVGRILSGWRTSGVITIQNGLPVTFVETRAGIVYGASDQLAELCPGETYASIETTGPTESKLNDFYSPNAFCAPPNLATSEAAAYGFGNMGRGPLYGSGQANLDMAVVCSFQVPGPSESSQLVLRIEFCNTLNHPQFSALPASAYYAPTSTTVNGASFGQITSTSVSPRLVQIGLKYLF